MLRTSGTQVRGRALEGGGSRGTCLTQHALGLPGVLVPGLDPVLHGPGDLVEVHVLHGAVHAAAVVGLPCGGGPHHVSHLGARRKRQGAEWGFGVCVMSTGIY